MLILKKYLSFLLIFFSLSSLSAEIDVTLRKFTQEEAILLEESENNRKGWPGVHWAIDKLNRPDIAMILLELFPEEAKRKTPERTKWCFNTQKAEERRCGFWPGKTSIELAAKNGYNDVVKRLLELGINPSGKREHIDGTTTPLAVAIEGQHKEVVKTLLENGVDVEYVSNILKVKHDDGTFSNTKYNALMYGIKHGLDDETLEWMIQAGMEKRGMEVTEIPDDVFDTFIHYTSVPQGKKKPWPALFHAFFAADYESSLLLFEYGAEPYTQCISKSLLDIAWDVKEKEPRLFDLLFEMGLSEEIFKSAIIHQDQELVKDSLELGISFEKALKISLNNKNWDAFKLLLENGYLPEQEHILTIVQKGHVDIFQYLLENGYTQGEDYFIESINNNRIEIMKLILTYGNVSDESIENGIVIAIKKGHTEIYQYLLNI